MRHDTSGTAGPFRAPSTIATAPFRHAAPQRLDSQLLRNMGQTAPKTAASLHQIPANAIGVQFELANIDPDAEVVYNAMFALSSGINDWFTPLNARGEPDNSLWVPVTVDGNPAIAVPPAETLARYARRKTDFTMFPMQPPARLDGGDGICLFFRQCAIANKGTVRVFDGSIPDWRGMPNGQNPAQFSQALGGGWSLPGNYAVRDQPGAAADPNGLGPFSVPNAVVPLLSGPVLSVMSVGDSILSGIASQEERDMGIAGAGFWLARRLTRPGRPALHLNDAVTGMTSADFTRNAELTLAHFTPDVMLLQTYSANDNGHVPTREAAWHAFQRTMRMAAGAAAAGTRIVLLDSPPFCGAGSHRPAEIWEDVRLYANALIRDSGLPFVDADEVLGTGTNPTSYRPGMSPDQVHPGDAAARLLADAALRTLYLVHGIS